MNQIIWLSLQFGDTPSSQCRHRPPKPSFFLTLGKERLWDCTQSRALSSQVILQGPKYENEILLHLHQPRWTHRFSEIFGVHRDAYHRKSSNEWKHLILEKISNIFADIRGMLGRRIFEVVWFLRWRRKVAGSDVPSKNWIQLVNLLEVFLDVGYFWNA